jgi:DNA-binding MarR family transcriptional regulator
VTRWLDADEDRAWRAVRRLITVLPSRLARDLNQLGLSTADYEVLSTLSEKPGRRWGLKDFADKMQWSRSRLSHHAARMESRGLIEREPDPTDARGSIYHLTDEGFAILSEVAPGHLDSVRDRFLDHLTAEDLAALERIATRIADLPD